MTGLSLCTALRRPAASYPEVSKTKEPRRRRGVSDAAGFGSQARERALLGSSPAACRASTEARALDARPLCVLAVSHTGRILTRFSLIRKHGPHGRSAREHGAGPKRKADRQQTPSPLHYDRGTRPPAPRPRCLLLSSLAF